MDETKSLTKKEFNFIADKILEEECDFRYLSFFSKKQALKELKQNSNMAKRILEFYKTNIKRINYYFINGKKYYTITRGDKAGTEVVYYKNKKIGEFN